jgi:CheY-like chemotaxis protein
MRRYDTMSSNNDPRPPILVRRLATSDRPPPSEHGDRLPRSEGGPPPSSSAAAPIVVIDDSEIAREEIARVLREAGYQVVVLPSPIGATQAILRHGARVVIVDVFMPTIRGDRLLTLFRKNPRLEHVSIILVSGHSERELEQLQAEVQAKAVVSKHNLDRLPGIVKRLCAQGR